MGSFPYWSIYSHVFMYAKKQYNCIYLPLYFGVPKIARRDKKTFLSDQCKEIEENNRIGKTRDLFKKIRHQGNISGKDGHNKRTGMVWT